MLRITMHLLPPPDFRPRGFRGFASYSMVMDVLESVDPDLVRIRRTGRIQTDFSVRPLRSEGEGVVVLDVTTFTEETTLALSSAILRGELETRAGRFEIHRVETLEVNPRVLLAGSGPVGKFSVRFITPTFFRPRGSVRGGIYIPLPLPDRMLINLHKTWNRFLGPMEDDLEREEFHRWLESWGIVVSGLRVETRKVNDGDKYEVGFVGWANFSPNPAYYDRSFLRKVDALLRLGEIVNVGGMRSKGFGVISYRRHERTGGERAAEAVREAG